MKRIFQYSVVLGLALSFSAVAAPKNDSPVRVKGTVVDASGAPVDNAIIEVYTYPKGGMRFFEGTWENSKKIEAADGAFELELPVEGCLVLARNEGMAPDWRSFWRVTDEDQTLDFVLGTAGIISGTVVDHTGKPVPNAEVFVAAAASRLEPGQGGPNILAGKQARELFSARSGNDGKFQIKGFPTNATAQLYVKAPGLAFTDLGADRMLYQGNLPHAAGREDIRLELEPAGVIEGTIGPEYAGQSPPKAMVTVENPANQLLTIVAALPKVESGPDGKFRLVDVPAGNYSVRAQFGEGSLPERIAEPQQVTLESGQTHVLEKPITPIRGGWLEVTVVDARSRAAVSNANIYMYRDPQPGMAVVTRDGGSSGPDGKMLMRVVPDTYRVSANKQNLNAPNVLVEVQPNKTNAVELELPSLRLVRGVVLNPDGTPAADISVQTVGFYGGRTKPLKTDAEGKFEFQFAPQFYGQEPALVTILARDLKQNLAVSAELDEETETVELKLAPGITLAGEIESDGKPIEKPEVTLIFWATENRGMHLQGWSTNGSKPGSFEISALPVGHKYSVIASAKGHGQKQIGVMQAPATEAGRIEVEKIELRRATLKLAGKVVDADEKPVKDAQVNISGDGQPNDSTRTDKDGQFSFAAVCEGSLYLNAFAMSSHGSVNAEGGDTNVVVLLGSSSARFGSSGTSGKLQGTVTDPDGKPAKGAKIMALPSSGSQPAVTTREDGTFTLRWNMQPWQLESGDPILIVRDLERNLAIFETFESTATNISPKLAPALVVAGKVEDPEGKPLARAQISLMVLAGRTYSNLEDKALETNSEGKFEIRAVPVGPEYFIFAGLKGHGRIQHKLDSELESGSMELDTFVLSPADKMIAGQVMTPEDKPAAGAHVNVSGDGQPSDSVQTDRNGRFKFAVCDGEVRLYVSGQNSYANVSVEAGDTNIVVNLQGYGQPRRLAPARAPLKGKPLPDLATLGLAVDSAPANQPLLLCLLDAEQRPSRRAARVLAEQCEALKQKGVCTLLVQTAAVSDEAITEWTNSVSMPFTIGRVSEKTPANKWATETPSLPWLILRDQEGKVVVEGFPVEELESKLNDLLTPAIDLAVPGADARK
jgi:hypothetical protein